MGEACAGAENTGRFSEAMQTKSLVFPDAKNSTGGEEAVYKSAVRPVWNWKG